MLVFDFLCVFLGNDKNRRRKPLYIMRKKKGIILSEKLDAFFGEKFGVPAESKGIAIGEARGKAETILTVLRARLRRVPRETERVIGQITDPVALDSWAVQAATCQSLDEFAEAVK